MAGVVGIGTARSSTYLIIISIIPKFMLLVTINSLRAEVSVRNDASFILDSNLSIYEHQSTVCPNMPVRNLIYFTTMVERMVKGHNIYGMSCAQRLYDLCGLCAFLS